jgi:hypothetical protein
LIGWQGIKFNPVQSWPGKQQVGLEAGHLSPIKEPSAKTDGHSISSVAWA